MNKSRHTSPVYVVGHINPDTDSVASAIGYAWLIRERDGENAIAARAGGMNPQTTWVLNRLSLELPVLLTDASPRFDSVTRRLDTTKPDSPLRDAWAIASRTGGIAPVLNPDGSPFGLVTGLSLFNFFSQLVGTHRKQQEVNLSDILDMPCRQAADTRVPAFQSALRIRDVLNRILREEGDDFWVVNDAGVYQGICRRRDILNPPRLKVILVDHNESQQSIGSLDEAELLEIMDHHRLGNHSTRIPIRFMVDIVGSTSTLVSERIEENGLSAPPEIAGLLLAGLLADSLILTSPTTTDRDRLAAERLARWCFVGGSVLAGETIKTFGEKVIRAGSGLGVRTAEEIISTDKKMYESGGYKFSISQAEVSDMNELSEYLEGLAAAISNAREAKGLDFAVMMITDVVRNSSVLILDHPPPLLDDLPYPPQQDGTRIAEGVVSRKKQLLPVILGLLEV